MMRVARSRGSPRNLLELSRFPHRNSPSKPGVACPERAKRAEGQVRVLPGARFPKEIADFVRKKIPGRTHIEQRDQSGDFAPYLAFPKFAIFLRFSQCADFGRTPNNREDAR
jgi:hypothetical protein